MTDGDALLLALVRRKGGPHALADWLLERLPAEDFEEDLDRPCVCAVRSRTLLCVVRFEVRRDTKVWVKMFLYYKGGGRARDYTPCFFLDLTRPDEAAWLAKYLDITFNRRK